MKRLNVHSLLLIWLLGSAFITCKNDISLNDSAYGGEGIQPTFVTASKESGFNYGYYYYIPKSAKRKTYLFVEPPTPSASDDMKVHDEAAQDIIQWRKSIADEMGVVLLVPVFPRPLSGNLGSTLSLNRATLLNNTGSLARIDLQLICMIENVKKISQNEGINLESKIFLNGFSAAGKFVNRFTAIHPELVQAVASGGSDPILPISTLEGERLIYPVGIYDLKDITGNSFNLQNFITIPKFIYIGSADENDPLPYSDMFGVEERRVITKVLGSGVHERWGRVRQVYEELDPLARFVVYSGVGHTITNTMLRDIVFFFKNNMK